MQNTVIKILISIPLSGCTSVSLSTPLSDILIAPHFWPSLSSTTNIPIRDLRGPKFSSQLGKYLGVSLLDGKSILSFVRKHPSVRVVIPFLKIPSGPKFPSHRVKLQIPTIYLRPVLSNMTTIHVWLLQLNSQFVSHASHISTLQQPHVASSIRCTGIATRSHIRWHRESHFHDYRKFTWNSTALAYRIQDHLPYSTSVWMPYFAGTLGGLVI